ncbi:MAG: DUF1146 domain-containing protein [Bacilli bacterium]|nr:DUF1146 domain-containing protein [Bacilli bacterium]
MNIITILYILIIPLTIWVISAMRLEKLFKKNQRMQIVIFYVLISLGLSYLVVNFIWDFYEVSRIIT